MHIKVNGEYDWNKNPKSPQWVPVECFVSPRKIYIERVGWLEKGYWAMIEKPGKISITLKITLKEYKRLAKLLGKTSIEDNIEDNVNTNENSENYSPLPKSEVENALDGMELNTD